MQTLGRRQLFVYWRVAGADPQAAVQVLQALHAQWSAQWPGLVTGLYLRTDDPARVTMMETYALQADVAPQGLTPEQLGPLLDAADQATATWRYGARHPEWFDHCD